MSNFSITFGLTETRNTWNDWKLKPESPPMVPAPKPKTNYIDVPGRSKGPVDMTKVPFGRQTYERISGTWTFVIQDNYWVDADPRATCEAVRGWLHGRVTRMVLEEDPTHIYYGRFTVETPNRGIGPFAIQINYDLEPCRYLANGDIDTSWVSDASEWIDSRINPIPDADIHALFQ